MQIASRDERSDPARGADPGGGPIGWSDRAATGVAVALGFAFALAWTWLGVYGHDLFARGPRDFMIYLTTVWNTSSGLPYQSTILLKNSSHLAEHVAPLVLPLSLLLSLIHI